MARFQKGRKKTGERKAGVRDKTTQRRIDAAERAVANDGVDTRSLQAYLGHRNIQHTVRYAELAPTRFKNFWHD